MRSLYAKFQPSSFKTEGGDEDDALKNCKNAKFQTAPFGTKILLLIFAQLPLSLCSREIKHFICSLLYALLLNLLQMYDGIKTTSLLKRLKMGLAHFFYVR